MTNIPSTICAQTKTSYSTSMVPKGLTISHPSGGAMALEGDSHSERIPFYSRLTFTDVFIKRQREEISSMEVWRDMGDEIVSAGPCRGISSP